MHDLEMSTNCDTYPCHMIPHAATMTCCVICTIMHHNVAMCTHIYDDTVGNGEDNVSVHMCALLVQCLTLIYDDSPITAQDNMGIYLYGLITLAFKYFQV